MSDHIYTQSEIFAVVRQLLKKYHAESANLFGSYARQAADAASDDHGGRSPNRMKYSDQQRIEKMRETTEKLLRYVGKENITPEKIFAEEAVQWTVTTPLYNIGEHAANLSEDFKKQYPDIPWVKIAGLRHRLVHHYEDTNWTVICAIIFDVLPSFLDELKKLCPTP